MIAAGVVMIFAAIALACQHAWWVKRRDEDVAATVTVWAAFNAEGEEALAQSRRNELDSLSRALHAEYDAKRLADELHWSRLSIAVMQAEGDLLTEVLGAGRPEPSNVVPLRREGGR